MKHILCYGDSNTWGWVPLELDRLYPPETRWTGLLQADLGADYRVLEAGLNGRTTVFEDPTTPNRNGRAALPLILEMQRPLDLVIVMLGTNDTKVRFSATPRDITTGLAEIVKGIRAYPCGPAPGVRPEILIIAPAPLSSGIWNWPAGEGFGDSGIEKSLKLAEYYEVLAREMDCRFLDAGRWGTVSPLDGIHFTEALHRSFAEHLYPEVKRILG
jgi:lysophospholipase L1-like esterase